MRDKTIISMRGLISKIVADKFHTNHHEFVLRPQIENLIDDLVVSFDEPFADASAIPNYLLALETRKYVTVALTGLGGDELCGGYERYLGSLIAEKYQQLPEYLRYKVFPSLVSKMADSGKGQHFNERLKRFISSANYPFSKRYFNFMAKFDEDAKKNLFLPEIQGLIERSSDNVFLNYLTGNTENYSHINKMAKIDINTYLVDDLLTLSDRTSMAHSLEVRVPFVDCRMVEFFASLPSNLKIKGFTKKYLLKKAAERLLPKEVIYRRKMGFSVPLVLWFRNEMKNYIRKMLDVTALRKLGYFNPSYISDVLDAHVRGDSNYDERLWALVCFIRWHARYME